QVSNDTINLSHKNLNPTFFEVKDSSGNLIDSKNYYIDFESGKIYLKNLNEQTEVEVFALKLPDFLTQSYSLYYPQKVVENEQGILISAEVAPTKKFVPFEGLNTSGSISRRITVVNNQHAVTNS